MTTDQAKSIVRILNSAWPQNRMDEETGSIYASRLKRFSYDDAHKAVIHLMDTSKFRPSLSEVVDLLKPSTAELADEAFTRALMVARVHGTREARKEAMSPEAFAAVEAMGGFANLIPEGGKEHFQRQKFARIWQEQAEREARPEGEKRLGMGAGILRSLAGGK